jgi:hypothetical protein
MPSIPQVVAAAQMVAKMGSIPFREPEYARPSYASKNLSVTKTRPIPSAPGVWVDYITIQNGVGLSPQGYSAVIQYFTVTGENDPLTSTLRYRFKQSGSVLPTQEFDINNDIELGIDRAAALPWPAMVRRIYIELQNDRQLVLQVQNSSGVDQLAFAGLYGYYFPNLGDLPRGSLERGFSSGTDRARHDG